MYFLSLRLFADILNDTSILVEMLAPLFKAYFTILACLSSISKVYFKMLVGMSNPDEKISYFLLPYFHQGSSFLDKIWKKEGFSLWEKVLECSTSMRFNWASKDSVFSVYFIVALLDFKSREYMYYYYILLGYCGETTERNHLGSYGSG